jgi:hypothetical protein
LREEVSCPVIGFEAACASNKNRERRGNIENTP